MSVRSAGKPPKKSTPFDTTVRAIPNVGHTNITDVPTCPRCALSHYMVTVYELTGEQTYVKSRRGEGTIRYYLTCPRTNQPVFCLVGPRQPVQA